MNSADLITTIIDLGGQAVLLVLLANVWGELKTANARTWEMLQRQIDADEERALIEMRLREVERSGPGRARPSDN